jgi:hypothetical protein
MAMMVVGTSRRARDKRVSKNKDRLRAGHGRR